MSFITHSECGIVEYWSVTVPFCYSFCKTFNVSVNPIES